MTEETTPVVHPPRVRGKGTAKKADTAERRRKALELRKAGATYEQIAEQLDYDNRGSAWKAVDAALKEITAEPAAEVRQLELERLDALLLSLWKQARGGNLGAVDRVLRLMERRSKYLGLDSPARMEVDQQVRYVLENVDDADLT